MNQRRELYRDSENSRIAGVCAGIAEYFGLEVWLVRILTVTAFFLLAAPFVLVSYIAAWFILDKKPQGYVPESSGPVASGQSFGKGWKNQASNKSAKSNQKVEMKTKVWQAGEPPKQAFHDIQNQFAQTERRLRKMETYVTSREYQLNREISQL